MASVEEMRRRRLARFSASTGPVVTAIEERRDPEAPAPAPAVEVTAIEERCDPEAPAPAPAVEMSAPSSSLVGHEAVPVGPAVLSSGPPVIFQIQMGHISDLLKLLSSSNQLMGSPAIREPPKVEEIIVSDEAEEDCLPPIQLCNTSAAKASERETHETDQQLVNASASRTAAATSATSSSEGRSSTTLPPGLAFSGYTTSQIGSSAKAEEEEVYDWQGSFCGEVEEMHTEDQPLQPSSSWTAATSSATATASGSSEGCTSTPRPSTSHNGYTLGQFGSSVKKKGKVFDWRRASSLGNPIGSSSEEENQTKDHLSKPSSSWTAATSSATATASGSSEGCTWTPRPSTSHNGFTLGQFGSSVKNKGKVFDWRRASSLGNPIGSSSEEENQTKDHLSKPSSSWTAATSSATATASGSSEGCTWTPRPSTSHNGFTLRQFGSSVKNKGKVFDWRRVSSRGNPIGSSSEEENQIDNQLNKRAASKNACALPSSQGSSRKGQRTGRRNEFKVVPLDESDEEVEKPPRKRGRPKGSKNKPKVEARTGSTVDGVRCKICRENFAPMSMTTCGHMFHSDCLQKWFEVSKQQDARSKTCPFCNSKFDKTYVYYT